MKHLRKIWGVGIVLVMLAALLVSAAPVAADELAWSSYSLPSTASNILVTTAGLDILDVAVAADGNTIYLTTGAVDNRVYKSTNGGKTWSTVSTTNLPNPANLIAVAPDSADIIAVAGGANNLTFATSTNGGSSFSALPAVGAATAVYDVAISALSGSVRNIAAAGIIAGPAPSLYYFNLGSSVPTWVDAVTDPAWVGEPVAPIDSIRGVAFSPAFASDLVAVAVSEEAGALGVMRFHILSFNQKKWDSTAGFTGYPFAIYTATGALVVNRARISLDPAYLGGDDSLRIGFVAADLLDGASQKGGIFRLKDTSVKALLENTAMYSIAWNGVDLVAGPTASNTVKYSADAMATSPTVSSASTLKRPGVDGVCINTVVKWAGANVVGGVSGGGSAFAISTDKGKTFNEVSLIDTALTNLEDLLVVPDGSRVFFLSNDGGRIGLVGPAAGVGPAPFALINIAGATISFTSGTAAGATTLGGVAVAVGTSLSTLGTVTIVAADQLGIGTTFSANILTLPATAAAFVLTNIAGGTISFFAGVPSVGVTTLGGAAIVAGTDLGTLGTVTIVAADQLGIGSTLTGTGSTSLWVKTTEWWRVWNDNNVAGYIIRGAPDNKDVFYIADTTGTNMWYTDNGGMSKWFPRSSRYNVQDLALESADVAYVATTTNTVSKSTNKGFTWGDEKSASLGSGNCYSITVIGKDKLLVGSTAGYVSYSSDGNANWTKIDKVLSVAGNTVVTASSLDTGGYIYAATSGAASQAHLVQRWQIGTSTSWKDLGAPNVTQTFTIGPGADVAFFGIALSEGVLYALAVDTDVDVTTPADTIDSAIVRTLGPTDDAPGWSTSNIGSGVQTTTAPSALRTYPGTTTLMAIDVPNDKVYTFQDTLTTAKPGLSGPADAAKVSVNLISGNVYSVSLSWSRPSKATIYDVQVALDSGFNEKIVDTVWPTTGSTTASTIAANVMGTNFNPDTKYYWRVRVNSAGPIRSPWSDTRSFTIAAATPPPVVTVTPAPPAPVITLPAPVVNLPPPTTITIPPAPTITIPPPPAAPAPIAPAYIWAVVIIGAILVIAVIVLIVRTRRPV